MRRQGPSSFIVTSNFNSYRRTVRYRESGSIQSFICIRFGHMAKDCRVPQQQQQRFGGPQSHERAGHRVGAVSYRRL